MNKTKILFLSLSFLLICTSCKKVVEEVLEPEPEPDFKVIQFHYGYDNYQNNIKDKDGPPLIIKERNLLIINVYADGVCEIEEQPVETDSIVTELKKYLVPSPENETMPMTVEKEFKHAGKLRVNKSLIVLALIDKDLDYKRYSDLRNKFHQAYNGVRNDFALEKYGKTLGQLISSEDEMDNERYYELSQIFPFNYTESVEN